MTHPSFSRYAIILGAGASHGAQVETSSPPPLDYDFLQVARLVLCRRGRGNDDSRAWRLFCQKLSVAGLSEKAIKSWRLEQLSTYLEARANMPALQHSAGKPGNYAAALEALSHVICRTLARTGGVGSCRLHRALVDAVQPHCVVTFNYDLIADQTLIAMNRLAWSHELYCGGSLRIRNGNSEYALQRPRRRHPGAIPLLKLHGSINWRAHSKGGGFSLVVGAIPSTDLAYAGPPDTPLVVPPVAAKMDIRRGALRETWSRAARELREAPGWIIWGYSLPPTDTVTHVLLRTALGKNRRPKPVIVVNPDPAVGLRIKEALQKVRVRSWLSIERFLLDHGRIVLAATAETKA